MENCRKIVRGWKWKMGRFFKIHLQFHMNWMKNYFHIFFFGFRCSGGFLSFFPVYIIVENVSFFLFMTHIIYRKLCVDIYQHPKHNQMIFFMRVSLWRVYHEKWIWKKEKKRDFLFVCSFHFSISFSFFCCRFLFGLKTIFLMSWGFQIGKKWVLTWLAW